MFPVRPIHADMSTLLSSQQLSGTRLLSDQTNCIILQTSQIFYGLVTHFFTLFVFRNSEVALHLTHTRQTMESVIHVMTVISLLLCFPLNHWLLSLYKAQDFVPLISPYAPQHSNWKKQHFFKYTMYLSFYDISLTYEKKIHSSPPSNGNGTAH
jgi:hypothetical protein